MNNGNYNTYGYEDEVPFKRPTCGCGDKETIKEAVQEALASGDLHSSHLSCQIRCAKDQIIDEIHAHSMSPCGMKNLATKEDIKKVVEDVNRHTDDKFNEADFDGKFSDLNEQMKALNGRFQ